MEGVEVMEHFTNRSTLAVYGYESLEEAQAFNDDFENLVEMTDELFQEFREQPIGGKWTLAGWVIDNDIVKAHRKRELESELATLRNDLIFATAMGDDTAHIAARITEVREVIKGYD